MECWRGSFLGFGARSLGLAMATLLLVAVADGMQEPAAGAAGCPNEQLRARQVHASELPDCRAYEQVSPVDKNGVDAVGGREATQASQTGVRVYYFSEAPFPQAAGSASEPPFYLGARALAPEEWLTTGLTPPTEPSAGLEKPAVYNAGSTEDLTRTVVVEQGEVLAPGATPGKLNAYVRDDSTGAYQLLAGNLTEKLFFADGTPGGSHILFETKDTLPVSGGPKPAPGVTNLYEWNEARPPAERVSVAGVLPSSEGGQAPVKGSLAGGRGSGNHEYTQNTISQDGSRVFFTDAGTGRIYMREPRMEPAVTIAVSNAEARWQGATPSGSYVFYVEGGELHRFSFIEKKEIKDEKITSGAGGVLGTLGVSSDGAYAYFVAPGVLASNKREHLNVKKELVLEEAVLGADNLYEWHEGAPAPVFIARLEAEDASDWSSVFSPDVLPPAAGGKGALVAPDGKTVLFGSVVPLTGYENGTECLNGHNLIARPCDEFFRYVAGPGRLSCVSCNPRKAPATEEPYFTKQDQALTNVPTKNIDAFTTRNLSADGTRVFFESDEALVPQDENNQTDVYEWEAEGAGSCTSVSPTFDLVSGGCLYLISTGQSAQQSYFGDASADGSSVFFFTHQSLATQDQDDNQDLYDARVAGGIAAQNPPPLTSCTGDACRGGAQAPPVFGVPSSLSLVGFGNLAAAAPATAAPKRKCVKGKRSSHGKCVKPKRGRRPRAGKAREQRRRAR